MVFLFVAYVIDCARKHGTCFGTIGVCCFQGGGLQAGTGHRNEFRRYNMICANWHFYTDLSWYIKANLS